MYRKIERRERVLLVHLRLPTLLTLPGLLTFIRYKTGTFCIVRCTHPSFLLIIHDPIWKLVWKIILTVPRLKFFL